MNRITTIEIKFAPTEGQLELGTFAIVSDGGKKNLHLYLLPRLSEKTGEAYSSNRDEILAGKCYALSSQMEDLLDKIAPGHDGPTSAYVYTHSKDHHPVDVQLSNTDYKKLPKLLDGLRDLGLISKDEQKELNEDLQNAGALPKNKSAVDMVRFTSQHPKVQRK